MRAGGPGRCCFDGQIERTRIGRAGLKRIFRRRKDDIMCILIMHSLSLPHSLCTYIYIYKYARVERLFVLLLLNAPIRIRV